jgi:hypothetical protein
LDLITILGGSPVAETKFGRVAVAEINSGASLMSEINVGALPEALMIIGGMLLNVNIGSGPVPVSKANFNREVVIVVKFMLYAT